MNGLQDEREDTVDDVPTWHPLTGDVTAIVQKDAREDVRAVTEKFAEKFFERVKELTDRLERQA